VEEVLDSIECESTDTVSQAIADPVDENTSQGSLEQPSVDPVGARKDASHAEITSRTMDDAPDWAAVSIKNMMPCLDAEVIQNHLNLKVKARVDWDSQSCIATVSGISLEDAKRIKTDFEGKFWLPYSILVKEYSWEEHDSNSKYDVNLKIKD
jgi:hypothetical protein